MERIITIWINLLKILHSYNTYIMQFKDLLHKVEVCFWILMQNAKTLNQFEKLVARTERFCYV